MSNLHVAIREILQEQFGKFSTRITELEAELKSARDELTVTRALSEKHSSFVDWAFDAIERIEKNEIPTNGKDGINGKDGADGIDGIGKDGLDGKDGIDGIGKTGERGESGLCGADGRDGVNGMDATDGADGRDGMDRLTIAPHILSEGKSINRNEFGLFGGGIWLAIRKTTGTPDEDPAGYVCAVRGIAAVGVSDDMISRTRTITTDLTDGTFNKSASKIQGPALKIYEAGVSYTPDDLVVFGDGIWSQIEPTDTEPNSNDWTKILHAPRGRKGAAGVDGVNGSNGTNGRGIKSVVPDSDGIMVEFDDGDMNFIPVDVEIEHV